MCLMSDHVEADNTSAGDQSCTLHTLIKAVQTFVLSGCSDKRGGQVCEEQGARGRVKPTVTVYRR